MIPQAHRTISVEILGLAEPLLLQGPDARSFVRRFEKIWSRSGGQETDLRVRIRHSGAGATGSGELVGAVLDNGSLRFGAVEVKPIAAFLPWMDAALAGRALGWPPEKQSL